MAGIAGILKRAEKSKVQTMLETLSHRGTYGNKIFELEDATIGMVWSIHEDKMIRESTAKLVFRDGPGYGQFAEVTKSNGKWEFHRDDLGVVPLYFALNEAEDDDEPVFFASEVKALLPYSKKIMEMPPGSTLSDKGIYQNVKLVKGVYSTDKFEEIAEKLRFILRNAVRRRIYNQSFGLLLSGGIDSSSIGALAKPYVKTLHTFSGGLKNSMDLKYAREVANFIGSDHHEIVITLDGMLRILPDVINQLESFDALLVRSGIINLSVAYAASNFVSDFFTGDGGDELFGGYNYLKEIPLSNLDDELIDLTNRLHNTALQRVDRSAAAFGITAHTVFTDPDVFEFAFRIPPQMKIKDGMGKWILRIAMNNLLPDRVLTRTKEKFWEGSGVGTMLWEYSTQNITDADFIKERKLKNGWTLNSKEELFYYRIFKEFFGEPENLDWVGRTKGSLTFESIGNNSSKITA